MGGVAAAFDREPAPARARPTTRALATTWREVGGVGRLATAGVVLSAIVAIVLGLWIEASVRHHLLEVRRELIQRIIDDLLAEGLLPLGDDSRRSQTAVAGAVRHRLIGGEIVRVAIHDATGARVYGERTQDPLVTPSLSGTSRPHVEQHPDGLLHFAVPVATADGPRLGTVEVFQLDGSFDAVLARVRRNLRMSIVTGLGSLFVAMGAFTLAHARVIDRRRRHAEGLLRDLLRVEDEERRRIVGSLHDDIGQPLYRLLYGLEGCRARLDRDGEVDTELGRLGQLVRDIDGRLRAELHHLHRSSLDALDMRSALAAAAEGCREECGLRVRVTVDLAHEPAPVARSVLLRAVQEGLVNVRKHAQAATVTIRVVGDARQVSIEIEDDGDGPTGPPGLGLTTAAERLASLGGGLAFGPASPCGSVLRVWAPLDSEDER